MFNTLIEANELRNLLHSNIKCCIFDCRFSLADTSAGKKLWLDNHISGAFYAHLDNNLSSEIIPSVTGRHPLPDKQNFVNWLRLHGVNQDTQIVAYDSAGGAIASRLWWLCQWIGHEGCAVLNGGIEAWKKIGQTDNNIPGTPGSGDIKQKTSFLNSCRTSDVERNTEALLIDAREQVRYLGEHEPIDPIAGRIPGAVSYPFTDNLDEFGKFKNTEALRERFSTIACNQKELIIYCGSGVTAIHNILAMAVAGFDYPTLYEDSWSGWILDPKRPIETGPI